MSQPNPRSTQVRSCTLDTTTTSRLTVGNAVALSAGLGVPACNVAAAADIGEVLNGALCLPAVTRDQAVGALCFFISQCLAAGGEEKKMRRTSLHDTAVMDRALLS